MSPILVSFDSVIGVGKSTLLTYFENVPYIGSRRVVILREEDSDWVERGILQKYYEDPERYAFCFQV
jgi:deoxyadenosine/deoxycytidine kinase